MQERRSDFVMRFSEGLSNALNTFGFNGGTFCPPERSTKEYQTLSKSLIQSTDTNTIKVATQFLRDSRTNLDLIVRAFILYNTPSHKIKDGYLSRAYLNVLDY